MSTEAVGPVASPGATWRKSSYSSGDNACVEIAHTSALVGIRDSKSHDSGALLITAPAWRGFLAVAKSR